MPNQSPFLIFPFGKPQMWESFVVNWNRPDAGRHGSAVNDYFLLIGQPGANQIACNKLVSVEAFNKVNALNICAREVGGRLGIKLKDAE